MLCSDKPGSNLRLVRINRRNEIRIVDNKLHIIAVPGRLDSQPARAECWAVLWVLSYPDTSAAVTRG